MGRRSLAWERSAYPARISFKVGGGRTDATGDHCRVFAVALYVKSGAGSLSPGKLSAPADATDSADAEPVPSPFRERARERGSPV